MRGRCVPCSLPHPPTLLPVAPTLSQRAWGRPRAGREETILLSLQQGSGRGFQQNPDTSESFREAPRTLTHKLRLPGIIKHFHLFKELSYALSHSDSQRSYRAGIINPFENGCGGLLGCITRGPSSVLRNPVSPLHQRPLPTACCQPGTARRETTLLGKHAWRTPNSLPYALRTAVKAKKGPPNPPFFPSSLPPSGQTWAARDDSPSLPQLPSPFPLTGIFLINWLHT